MNHELPPTVEICAHVQNGLACGGVIWRPEFGKPTCWKCGSNEAGVVYVRKETVD